MEQEPRRALIELLFLAIYLDGHLSLLEDAALEKALASLGWAPGERSELDVGSAFALAREAGSCELKTEEFLQARVKVLKDAGESSTAIEWLGRVLAADGLTGGENRFLERFIRLLGA